MPPGERLDALAALVGGRVIGDPGLIVGDVTHDSRQAGPGSAFVAIRGYSVDGHDFVNAAVERGASALVVETEQPTAVPQLVVGDTRAALGPLSAAVHGNPSARVPVVGVTGTNGKTSVTFLIESIATAAGLRPGLIGTVQTRIGDERIPTLRTTPEASDFQRLLSTMVERGADLVVCEVSSHALRLGRVDATHFEVVAFTNLSQDHLDFHTDMEDYYRAKATLFDSSRAGRGVVWVDDPAGRRLVDEATIPVVTVGTSADADVVVEVKGMDLTGSGFVLRPTALAQAPEIEHLAGEFRIPIAGAFNVANAAIAATCAALCGVDGGSIRSGLAAPASIPGRFELVSGDDPIHVIVDYAHTPAGIAGVIEAARGLVTGRVLCVFGAGGDRDRTKRPGMGAAAAAADIVVVTSDNPRNEDPAAIIDQVLEGIPDHPHVERHEDRAQAIDRAIDLAAAGDVVLVLGKGHERGQEIAGRMIPFDDRMTARASLFRKGSER
ncbi:MAG TPA: UDP-N-acetylmuramoyl-L-alanyl-D-glutamate--2,6-diaminopimelate ligase [Acidimicrobiia bacterium]